MPSTRRCSGRKRARAATAVEDNESRAASSERREGHPRSPRARSRAHASSLLGVPLAAAASLQRSSLHPIRCWPSLTRRPRCGGTKWCRVPLARPSRDRHTLSLPFWQHAYNYRRRRLERERLSSAVLVSAACSARIYTGHAACSALLHRQPRARPPPRAPPMPAARPRPLLAAQACTHQRLRNWRLRVGPRAMAATIRPSTATTSTMSVTSTLAFELRPTHHPTTRPPPAGKERGTLLLQYLKYEMNAPRAGLMQRSTASHVSHARSHVFSVPPGVLSDFCHSALAARHSPNMVSSSTSSRNVEYPVSTGPEAAGCTAGESEVP